MLARVTPRALSALPGVFIVLPTKKSAGKGAGAGAGGSTSKAETDPELAGSNVLSVGEGVLLKWLSYHLEQANRVSDRFGFHSGPLPCPQGMGGGGKVPQKGGGGKHDIHGVPVEEARRGQSITAGAVADRQHVCI